MLLNLALRWFILLGAPLALVVLILFHPWPYDGYSNELILIARWWVALHTVTFVLFAFTGAVFWLLTNGLQGADASISRLGVVVFAIFYNVGDAVASISTGILARAAADAPRGERDTSVESIETLFADPMKDRSFEVGFYACIVALVAAAVALCRAGAPRSPLLLFTPAAYFLTSDRAVPFISLDFGFFLGILWLDLAWRGHASARAESPLVQATVSGSS